MAELGPLGAFLAFGLIMILVGLAIYIYTAIALMIIANKTKTKNGWLAFIPVANLYLMTQIGKLPWWWLLVIVGLWIVSMIPIIGIIASIAMLVVMAYLWWKVAEAVNKPGWWGILMVIPIVNLVMVGIMAWGK